MASDEAKHVFVSYVREDADRVDALCAMLEAAQIPYWRDRTSLGPGDHWKYKIRDAIRTGALVFLACFSERSRAKPKSYMNEELTLAVEEFRKLPPGATWLIPVRFDDGDIPDWDLGAGRSLNDLNFVDLYGQNHMTAAVRLTSTINQLMGVRNPDTATQRASIEAQMLEASGLPRPNQRGTDTIQFFPFSRNAAFIADKYVDTTTVPRQLPHDIPEFVGRDNLLEILDAATQDDSPDNASRVVILDGMAGVGKTALVVHWAHRARHRFPGGDFFVDLHGFSNGLSVAQAAVVDEFLIALDYPPSNNLPPRSKELLLKRLLTNRRALVILDNARNTAHVKDLVALLPNCSVVVTSRQQLTQLRTATGARRVHVDPMKPPEATELLSTQLGDRHDISPEDRALLVKLCGGLPLVISVLAQHIASRPAAHLTAFARQLDRRQLLTDIGEDGDGSVTAETFFYSSYRALNEPERRLFRLLSLNPGPDIDEAAARACDGRTLAEVGRSLRILVTAHLLDQPETFDRYRFHDLIREFARHRAEADESPTASAAAERRLLSHCLSAAVLAHRTLYPGNLIADDIDVEELAELVVFADGEVAKTWFDRERINLVAAIHLAANQGYHEYAWRLTNVVGTFLDRQGYYEDSRTVRQLSVASAHAANHRVGEASTLVGLGMVQMILGDHTAARSSLDAALHIVEADGNEHGQASTLHQLGRLEVLRGNPDGAIAFYDRCLDIAQRAHDYEGLCWTHCRIAEPLRTLNQHDKALTHSHQSQFHAQRIGDESAHASSMIEIGSIYRDRGDHPAAIAHCERALMIVEDMPIPDLAVRTSACIVLAEIHNEQHDTEISSSYILRAIELAQDAHNTTAEAHALEVYGDIQCSARELAGAVQAWHQAAEHFESIGNVRRTAAIHEKINNALASQTTMTAVRTNTTQPSRATADGTPEP